MFGIYKALKRRGELDSTLMFTNNLQVWLAVFAFSSFIVASITPSIWGWWTMHLSIIGWVAFVAGSLVVIGFIVVGIYSLCRLFVLMFKGIFGQRVKVDPNMPPNILGAIEPITEEANLKECKTILSKLIKERDGLNKAILNYQAIISNLERENGNKGKSRDSKTD